MNNELQSIEIDGRKFFFAYRHVSDDLPLVVVLHGHNREPKPSKLRSEEYNILCPVDNFGHNGYGSWFLGEKGDFFWIEGMRKLISHVGSGNEIYFMGSSMGGYGAILHGTINKAVGVYANIPQTKLIGSRYMHQGMRKYFENIFENDSNSKFNDLRDLIDSSVETHFDISAIRWDKEGYLQEQIIDFAEHLTRNEISFSLQIFNTEGHGLTMPLHEAVLRLKSVCTNLKIGSKIVESHSSNNVRMKQVESRESKGAVVSSNHREPARATESAEALFVKNVVDPESMWAINKAHMAPRFSKFVERYAKSLGSGQPSDVAADIIEKARKRSQKRPLTVFIVNPGSCGSHWLQAMLCKHFRMSGCGEAYVADSVMKFIDNQAEESRSFLIDCLHLAHSYDGALTPIDAAMVNTAHASGWAISAAMSEPSFRILLVRDPLNTVISRTFRKPRHRAEFFNGDTDESYLKRNIEYVLKFYRHMKDDNFNFLVRFEDMRVNMRGVIEQLEQPLSNYTRGHTIEETLAFLNDSAGSSTNKFKGVEPEIPSYLIDQARTDLKDIRSRLGYAV